MVARNPRGVYQSRFVGVRTSISRTIAQVDRKAFISSFQQWASGTGLFLRLHVSERAMPFRKTGSIDPMFTSSAVKFSALEWFNIAVVVQ